MSRTASATIILILSVILASVTALHAEWIENGNPIVTAPRNQQYQFVLPNGEGGALIVWLDARDGSWHPYAQRIDKDGIALWDADGIRLDMDFSQAGDQLLRPDGSGGATMTYVKRPPGPPPHTDLGDIYAQKIDKNAVVLWPDTGVVICTADGNQWRPWHISDGSGGAVIAWEDARISNEEKDIYAQRIDSDGNVLWQENGIPICTAPGTQWRTGIASDGAGGAFITWADGRDDNNLVYIQRIDGDGNMLWEENGRAYCSPSVDPRWPGIHADGTGGAIVVWYVYRLYDEDLFAQRIDADGSALWGAEGRVLSTAPDGQRYPGVIPDGSGGAIITWEDWRIGGSDSADIYVQRFSASGDMLWPENGHPVCSAPFRQNKPRPVTDGAGGIYVLWSDKRKGNDQDSDVYAQWIDADGNFRWEEFGRPICTADDTQFEPKGITDGEGGAFVAWIDNRNNPPEGNNSDIYATRIFSEHALTVTLDIKPGSCPNPFNPKSNGVLPAAVLGSEDLDVSDIDPSSLLLEGIPPLRWRYDDVGAPAPDGEGTCTCTEEGPDGYDDLTLKFKTPEIADALGTIIAGETIVLTLTGSLKDGTEFVTHACVIARGGKEGKIIVDHGHRPTLYVASSPSAPVQIIKYKIPEQATVEINVYDVAGRCVKRLTRASMPAGVHVVEWNTAGAASGVYFLRIKAASLHLTRKLVLIR